MLAIQDGRTVGAVVDMSRGVSSGEGSTAIDSLLSHESRLGNVMTIENCIELSRRRAMDKLFSEFKFKPRGKAALTIYQIRLMKELGYKNITGKDLEDFRERVWGRIKETVTEGVRSKRSSVNEALDKRVVGMCGLLFVCVLCGCMCG